MITYQTDEDRISHAVSQTKIPVIFRLNTPPLLVKLPYAKGNRDWLRNGLRNEIHFTRSKFWELPNAWFDDTVDRVLNRYGQVYVIQPYREQEKCAPACLNAKGHTCQCSCMGKNHGAGSDRTWFEISETFAVRWHDEQVACRLMVRR